MGTVFGRNWIGLGNEDGSRQNDQGGEVRRTWNGQYQAYDNQGRTLGAPQASEVLAANTGSNELTHPTPAKRWRLW